jgi:hypothetical protein
LPGCRRRMAGRTLPQMSTQEFKPFPKLARLSREMIVTEKIDGTNAQVCILDGGTVLAGSRTRWITPEQDNFGFARWVKEHEDELRGLGPGQHFGEWWGPGIQRGYGLAERKFSLFNTSRWSTAQNIAYGVEGVEAPPFCCDVVPVIYKGEFKTSLVDVCLSILHQNGSFASPGFMRPEGVVVFHTASNTMFKKTFDDGAKGQG